MAKKLKLDREDLSVKNTELSKKQRIKRLIISQIITIFVLTIVFFIIFSYIFETPEQKKLKRETKVMEEQYKYLIERYDQTEKVLEDLKERDKNIYMAIFEAPPPADNDTVDINKILQNADVSKISHNLKYKIDTAFDHLKNEKELISELLTALDKNKKGLRNIPAILPVEEPDIKLMYGFGKRIDPVYKTPSFHKGIDFALPKGTEVYATADGKVVVARERRGYGKHVIINHGNGYKTIYAHLDKINVKKAQKVKRGEIIGFVGNTGKSLVAHLHYQVNYNDQPVNPVYFFFADLTPEEFAVFYKYAQRGGLSLD